VQGLGGRGAQDHVSSSFGTLKRHSPPRFP